MMMMPSRVKMWTRIVEGGKKMFPSCLRSLFLFFRPRCRGDRFFQIHSVWNFLQKAGEFQQRGKTSNDEIRERKKFSTFLRYAGWKIKPKISSRFSFPKLGNRVNFETTYWALASYNKICRFLIFFFFVQMFQHSRAVDNRPRFIFTPKQESRERNMRCYRASWLFSVRPAGAQREKKQIKYISRVLCRPKVVVEILGNPLRRRNIYAGPFIYTTLSNAKSNGGTAIFHGLLIRTLCVSGVGLCLALWQGRILLACVINVSKWWWIELGRETRRVCARAGVKVISSCICHGWCGICYLSARRLAAVRV